MSNQLLDENGSPIPICNVIDEAQNVQLYVPDTNSYLQLKKTTDGSKNYTIIVSAIMLVLFCIFSLNLSAAGWTLGNILTFLIIIICIYFVTLFGKKWMVSTATISQIVKQGNPCSRTNDNKSTIYCNRHV